MNIEQHAVHCGAQCPDLRHGRQQEPGVIRRLESGSLALELRRCSLTWTLTRRYLVVAENLMLLEYIKLLRPRFNAYWCGCLCGNDRASMHTNPRQSI